MKKYFLVFFLLSICIITIFLYNMNFNIKMEKVGTFQIVDNNFEHAIWYTLRDSSYQPFYDYTALEKETKCSFENFFDTTKYTYVVVRNYEADKLQFSLAEMKNRTKACLPKQFVGVLTLGGKTPGYINVYRIKKIDIDSDVHNKTKGIIYNN